MDVVSSRQKNVLLRQERIARNWHQSDLAEHLGTTAVTVRRWERGNQQPSPYFRVKLCALFGKSLEELGLVSESPRLATRSEAEVDPSLEAVPLSPFLKSPDLWSVPYPRNPLFTGREALLHTLHEKLSREHSLALTQSWAIGGLGGIGKTQIALEYAYQYRHDYAAIFWISAATRETLLAGLVTLAEIVQIPEKDEHDQRKVIQAVNTWLATHQGWLFILDNADDITMVHDVLPTERGGHLLLTTRAQALGTLAQRIEVETMGMAEGTLFLLRRAKRLAPDLPLDYASPEQLTAAEAIVIAMDFLPLALDQAGAYIEEVGCSLTTYLEIYHTHRAQLLHRRGQVLSDHPEPVATTWSLNFQQVEQANPAAAELLRLCAFLEPDAIPEELISEGSAALGPVLQHAATDAFTLNEAIEELRKFSLVQRDSEAKLLRLHRLVQAVLIDAMEGKDRRQWAERAVRATNRVFPETIEMATWSRCRRYLSQTQACTLLIQDYTFASVEVASLLFRTASYLFDYALYEQAEPLYQQAVHMWEQSLGAEHPEVARSLYGLGRLYENQGRYEQAEPLFQRAVHIQEQSLGPEHPEVARSLSGLAILYSKQGKYRQAEPFYQQAVRIQEQTLGPKHPNVAHSLNGLASLYNQQGKYEQAELLYRRALSIREDALGLEHPDVAPTLYNMARLYTQQGKYEQAEPLFQRALRIWEQVLGSEHPHVAYPLNSLAEIYEAQGKYEQAESFYLRALHIWEQALGPEHPNRGYPLVNLAELCFLQGKYEQAELLYQQVLHIWEQALGPEHPDLAQPLNGLANVYSKRGMDQQAEVLYQRALSLREQTQGVQHLGTAETLHDFAAFWEAQSKYQEAVVLYQRALAIREHVLGGHDPKTVETRNRLCVVLIALEREEEARQHNRAQPKAAEIEGEYDAPNRKK